MFAHERPEVLEQVKILRFCPNCFQLVKVTFRKRLQNQDHYDCTKCGETILVVGELIQSGNRWD